MKKRELAEKLDEFTTTVEEKINSMEVKHAIELREATAYRRALEQENRDGFWTSLDKSSTKRNRTWKDVEKNLKDAFSAWCVNPMAKSYVDYQRYFVVGKGTQIAPGEGEGDDAQERINLFCEYNDWSMLEKKIAEELSRDGEVFVRHVDDNRNDLQASIGAVALIDPLEITDIAAEDVNNPTAYRHVYTKVTWDTETNAQTKESVDEWLLADEIRHIKINCSHNELRGRSDLLVVLPTLKQLKAWRDNNSRRNYLANAFVWDVLCTGGRKPSAVTAQYPNGPISGSVIAHSENETWTINAPDMKWADSSEGARDLKLDVCAGYKLPESWFGDTGESNLATTKALAMPSLKAFQDRQDFLKEHFEQIISRGSRVENVEVTFCEIVNEDAKLKADALVAVANALNMLTTDGLLSRETAYGILKLYVDELDEWDNEDAGEKVKIAQEEREDVGAITQGSKVGSIPRPALEGETGVTGIPT